MGRVAIDVVSHFPISEQSPHIVTAIITHTVDVILKDTISVRFQVGFALFGKQAGAASDHDVQVVVSHLWGDPFIFATVVAVGGTVGRCRMREFAGENQSRRFALFYLGRFQDGCQRLESACRIGRVDIVVAVVLRISGNVACTAGLSCHVAGSRRGRVSDRCIRRMCADCPAEIRVDVQFRFVGVGIPLQPTRHGNSCQRCPVRDQKNDILHRLNVFYILSLCRHEDDCQ